MQSRGTVSTPLMPGSLVSPPYNSCAWYEKENLVCITDINNRTVSYKIPTLIIQSRAQAALHVSNEDLACRLVKLKVNTGRLQRELFLLQRHIKEFQCPLFETYEADILTRLIDVAHAHQDKKMKGGTAISFQSIAEREIISRAYINASKQVQEETIEKLGLSNQHYLAICRYEEVRKCFSLSRALARAWKFGETEHRFPVSAYTYNRSQHIAAQIHSKPRHPLLDGCLRRRTFYRGSTPSGRSYTPSAMAAQSSRALPSLERLPITSVLHDPLYASAFGQGTKTLGIHGILASCREKAGHAVFVGVTSGSYLPSLVFLFSVSRSSTILA